MFSVTTFLDFLSGLSNSEVADLDDSYFVNLVRYAPIEKLLIYASTNKMTLVHCSLVVYLRPDVYPEFIEISGLPLKTTIKTFTHIEPDICGRILEVYGLRDPKFKTADSYIRHIKNILVQDPVYEKISRGNSVSLHEVTDQTAKRCLENDGLLETLVTSVLEYYDDLD